MLQPRKSPFCNPCEGCVVTNERPVPGEGPVPAKVMIVGEAPTSSAQAIGRPFPPLLGAAGDTLESWLDYLHLHREDVYVTNVVKCPRRGRAESSSFDVQARVCTQWLDREIGEVAPRLVIALGSIAQKRFSGGLPGREYSMFYKIWGRYPSAGQCKERHGIIYFTC